MDLYQAAYKVAEDLFGDLYQYRHKKVAQKLLDELGDDVFAYKAGYRMVGLKAPLEEFAVRDVNGKRKVFTKPEAKFYDDFGIEAEITQGFGDMGPGLANCANGVDRRVIIKTDGRVYEASLCKIWYGELSWVNGHVKSCSATQGVILSDKPNLSPDDILNFVKNNC